MENRSRYKIQQILFANKLVVLLTLYVERWKIDIGIKRKEKTNSCNLIQQQSLTGRSEVSAGIIVRLLSVRGKGFLAPKLLVNFH